VESKADVALARGKILLEITGTLTISKHLQVWGRLRIRLTQSKNCLIEFR